MFLQTSWDVHVFLPHEPETPATQDLKHLENWIELSYFLDTDIDLHYRSYPLESDQQPIFAGDLTESGSGIITLNTAAISVSSASYRNRSKNLTSFASHFNEMN